MIGKLISELVLYGVKNGLVYDEDKVYVTNRLLELFDVCEYEESLEHEERNLVDILNEMLDYAYEKGILKENTVLANVHSFTSEKLSIPWYLACESLCA